MTTSLQELMTDMLETPIMINVAVCEYQDGSTRAFTFSDNELMKEALEYFQEAGEDLGMVSYRFFDTGLDMYYDADYNLLTEH